MSEIISFRLSSFLESSRNEIKEYIIDLQDSFDSQRRLTKRKLSDIEQSITQLQNQVKELLDPEKDKKK